MDSEWYQYFFATEFVDMFPHTNGDVLLHFILVWNRFPKTDINHHVSCHVESCVLLCRADTQKSLILRSFSTILYLPQMQKMYWKNRTFGCKRLKVLFLYHFLDGKALKIASIEEKIYKIREPSYQVYFRLWRRYEQLLIKLLQHLGYPQRV